MLHWRPLNVSPVCGIPFMLSTTISHSWIFCSSQSLCQPLVHTVVGGKKIYLLFVGSLFEENQLPERNLFLLLQECSKVGLMQYIWGFPSSAANSACLLLKLQSSAAPTQLGDYSLHRIGLPSPLNTVIIFL